MTPDPRASTPDPRPSSEDPRPSTRDARGSTADARGSTRDTRPSTPDARGSAPRHRLPPAAIAIVPLVVAVVLALFAWPSARLAPHDLPVGVAGAPVATHAVEERLGGDAFDVHRYDSERAARRAVADREVYGAFVATAAGPIVLTASAASPAVAQMLTTAASDQARAGTIVPVEDVVASGHSGAAVPASVLPLIIAGILTGVLSGALAPTALRRAGVLVTGSVLAGLTATAIIQGWLGVVGGDWVANAAALSLVVLALASVIAGLQALLGPAGVAVGALTMILIGNPFSGIGSAPEMLPEPAGAIGRLMPPGAGGNLLRSTGFFDGAGAGFHIAVLAAWAAAGLGLLFAAALRARRGMAVPAPVPA